MSALHFKSVSYKNILSTGNQWTHIDLDQNKSTLVVGENGVGKCLRGSTEVDIEIPDKEVLKIFEEFIKNT